MIEFGFCFFFVFRWGIIFLPHSCPFYENFTCLHSGSLEDVYDGRYDPELLQEFEGVLPGTEHDPWIAEALLANVQPRNLCSSDQVSSRSWADVVSSKIRPRALQTTPNWQPVDRVDQTLQQVSASVSALGEHIVQFGEQVTPMQSTKNGLLLSSKEEERCRQFQLRTVRDLVDRWIQSSPSSVDGRSLCGSPLTEHDDQTVQAMHNVKQEPLSPFYSPTPSLLGMQISVEMEGESPRCSPTSSLLAQGESPRYSPTSSLLGPQDEPLHRQPESSGVVSTV